MPEAPLLRPLRHTVIRSFAGHLDAEPDAVFAALVAQLTPRTPEEGTSAVDESAHEFVVQGGWWYRAEYRALPEDEEHGGAGTRLEFELVNVAPSWHWAGPIAGRRVIRDSPQLFAGLVTAIDAELA